MELTALPLRRAIWAAMPCAAQALILAQRECIRELEARLSQHSSNSSRPPSSDPPHVPAKRRALPSGMGRPAAIAAPCTSGGLNDDNRKTVAAARLARRGQRRSRRVPGATAGADGAASADGALDARQGTRAARL
jgi:hypothetical protein